LTQPKITVVIPTRERLAVFRHSIQTVLVQQYDNLEIIVSDNCSTDGTRGFVESLDDRRIRYLNTGRRVSMSANWEFALSHVEAGWVMFLGDDDGVLPGAIAKLATVIEETDCEAITFRACSYFWPGGSNVGHLTVPLTRSHEVRNCRIWLERVMNVRAGFTELPILYVRGIVKLDAIDRIKEKGGGTFFKSCIPDVYSAIALASALDRYVFLSEALSIAGASHFSTGGAYGRSGASSEDKVAFDIFSSEENIPLHPDVPRLTDGAYPPSCHALIYESYLQSSSLRGPHITHSPGRHLELALAYPVSPAAEALNQAWGRIFATRHSLDFERHLKASVWRKRIQKIIFAIHLIRLGLTSVVVHDRSLRIHNVFEASVIASAVKWLSPSIFFRIRKAYDYRFRSPRRARHVQDPTRMSRKNP
jgi:glycosyltransferase involved in cell wall biosynthesis